ncbi:flagellar assembly protein FliW [Caldanaerobacter subterraneus subsp. pacificus DSM 12653]|uniref:Flagellar assembly factor FliW n=2 Tax=Caldanaerobacter subterraneus TaxID=911092 RepID=A0A0F5PP55_9THEO|nr:flagellar assembly protein FliW [Caldanaerobacter subterraneus subsp. pacificus DSM 12653]
MSLKESEEFRMELNTKNFGIIHYNEEDVIYFEEGIPGFEELHNFLIIGDEEEDMPFKWLQSIDDTDIAFVIIDPRVFKPNYTFEIDEELKEELQIEDINHLLIYVIVVIPNEIEKMTANLKAPIIINAKNNRGKQVILDNEEYLIKHPILEELKNAYSNA